MPTTLTLILLLIGATACLDVVAERLRLPRPVVLLCGGLAIALLPGIPKVSLDPETIFVIFIPPLLYWAALNSSLRDFRVNALVIATAGVVLVLVTIAAVALTAHAVVPGFDWAAAVVLGAIVAPPDAVVTLSMLRGITLPRAVTTILLGESLVNDATSLVVYRLSVAGVMLGHFSWLQGVLDFFVVSIGGIACGLALGWVMVALRKRAGTTAVLQNTLSLLTPFAAYLPANALHVSGVLAVVVTGLYLGRRGPHIIAAETRLQARDTWQVVTFVLEGLTFLLIGLDLPYARDALGEYSLWTLTLYSTAIAAVIALSRVALAFPTAWLPRWFVGRPAPRGRDVIFIAWAGLRGGDSLVVALTLPLVASGGLPFANRSLIIVLTFGVVLIAILFQGLTLQPLAACLGLRSDGSAETEERDARTRVAEAGLAALASAHHELGHIDPSTMAEVSSHAYRRLRSHMVSAERQETVRLRDANIISDEVMNRLLRALDLEAILLDSGGR